MVRQHQSLFCGALYRQIPLFVLPIGLDILVRYVCWKKGYKAFPYSHLVEVKTVVSARFYDHTNIHEFTKQTLTARKLSRTLKFLCGTSQRPSGERGTAAFPFNPPLPQLGMASSAALSLLIAA